jgi:hypothetical protein
VAFRSGSSKDAADENMIIRGTSDGGSTWDTVFDGFESTIENRRGCWRSGYVIEREPGWLIGCFNWFDRSGPSGPLANPQTQGTLPSRIFVIESFDSGNTWTRRREVDTAPYSGIAATGPILELVGGHLALPYESWKDYYDTSPGKHRAILRISDDNGYSFGPAVIVAHDPSGSLLFWDQRLAVHPKTGALVGLFWTHQRTTQQDVNVHIAWGSPDGKTWTKPVDTGFAGQIASPLILPDGRIATAYVHRHDPPSLRVVLSEDFGKTWDKDHELIFYSSPTGREAGMGGRRDFGDYWADMSVWSFGHPAPGLLPTGDLFVTFYAGDANSMSVRWVLVGL